MSRINDAEYARMMTQVDPLEIPHVTNAFFIRVKVDHEGVFVPRRGDAVFQKIKESLDLQKSEILGVLERLRPLAEEGPITAITSSRVNAIEPYWDNGMFEAYDARVAYAMVADLRPRRVIEVGSGHSTKFIRRAVRDYHLNTYITAIDPVPRDEIKEVADHIVFEPVQQIQLSVFDELTDGDILFWDGSHIVFNGTDTTFLFLEILPRLKPGVVVHIHDIQLPFEYERGYSAHYYNEQYMLAVLVLFSKDWKAIFPMRYIGEYIDQKFIGRSFWMRKVVK